MPETTFRVRWPDGAIETCYSPSTIVKTFFMAGEAYPLEDFLDRARAALHSASDRVRDVYGMHCSRAMAQLDAIEAKAKTQAGTPGLVIVESFSN